MRFQLNAFAALLLCSGATSALAGITVTSYTTTAETNAYAPLSGQEYFQQQTFTNRSPALADVSADWTGTNAGGSTTTWHWIGAAHIASTTTSDTDSVNIAGVGSFSHQLMTISGFVDPRSGSIYSPGSAADYQCYLTLDAPASYAVNAELGPWASVFLGSFETGFVFDRINTGTQTLAVDEAGTIPPGHYEVSVNASSGPPNLFTGAHSYAASGSFSSFNVSMQVPEPTSIGAILFIVLSEHERRARRARNTLTLET